MTKLKKKLTVIVAIFAAIAILGSTAAVFVGTRTNNNEQEVITSPVGYLEGVGVGTGKYASNTNTWVFAENDPSVFTTVNGVSDSVSKPVYYLGSYNVSETTDSTYKLTSDDNGNGYVEATTYKNGNDSTSFTFPIKNRVTSYSSRRGTYVFELDLMIPEEPTLTYEAGSTYKYFMAFCLSNMVSNSSSNYSSNYVLHDSSVDGYYYLDSSTKTQAAREKVLLKYGEWYNFRFEYKLDTSLGYSVTVYINDIEVSSITDTYSAMSSAPQYFRLVPRGYAHGMKWCMDNVYSYRYSTWY